MDCGDGYSLVHCLLRLDSSGATGWTSSAGCRLFGLDGSGRGCVATVLQLDGVPRVLMLDCMLVLDRMLVLDLLLDSTLTRIAWGGCACVLLFGQLTLVRAIAPPPQRYNNVLLCIRLRGSVCQRSSVAHATRCCSLCSRCFASYATRCTR